MKKSILHFCLGIFTVLLLLACNKNDSPDNITLGATACIVSQHHERILRGVDVYIKYNVEVFPGYDDLAIYDEKITGNDYGESCFQTTPIGKHWFVGIGFDSLLQVPVRGNVAYEIFDFRTPRDTILYISEY